MDKRTFEVIAVREGPWWVFEIPALGTGGQARSFAAVEYEAQGVAAVRLGVKPEAVQVHVTVKASEQALADGPGDSSVGIDVVRQLIRAESESRGTWGRAHAGDAWAPRVEEFREPPAAD